MSPDHPPPPRYDGTPSRLLLPTGTTLTRIHSTAFGVTEFRTEVPEGALSGGRFDATAGDRYPFLYAAADDATAVSEALLRDLPIDERGARLLLRAALSHRSIGWLRTTLDLELVSLRSGADLAAIGQDTWLTSSDAADYARTRPWASAIRLWAPGARGLTWRSRREPDGFAYVFFGDRCPQGCLEEVSGGLPLPPGDRELATGAARLHVEEILTRYRVAIM